MNRAVGAVLLALASAACWFGWLAWDRSYQVDPATGVASGPYDAWQVIGCALTLVGVTMVATTRLPPRIVIPLVPVAFTAAWSFTAATTDTQGLWPIGAALVLLGTLAGTTVATTLSMLLLRRTSTRRAGPPPSQ